MEFDWNVVSAIGTILCAIATFIACLISLYQTRVSNKKNLRLKVVYDSVFVSGSLLLGTSNNTRYMGLSITNIGNKTVRLCGFGYVKSVKVKLYYINPHICSDGNIVPFSEHVLEPEKSFTYYVERDLMLDYLRKEFKEHRKVFLFCVDSTQKYYLSRVSKKSICSD